MHEIDRYGIGQVMDMALKAVNPTQNKPIHVSFDIDSLDPYIAPATGTPVRGGLTYREAHYILEVLNKTSQLKSMDLVEINPSITPLYLQGSTETVGQATLELGIELIASALGKRIL